MVSLIDFVEVYGGIRVILEQAALGVVLAVTLIAGANIGWYLFKRFMT